VVLAAWGRKTRASSSTRQPTSRQGLANSNGLVGKYMMAHFNSGTWAMFDRDVQNHMGTTGAQSFYDALLEDSHKGPSARRSSPAGSAMKTSDLGWLPNARLDLFGPDFAGIHETRRTRPDPLSGPLRGDAEHREPCRACQRQGRFGYAGWKNRPQLTRTRSDLEREFEEGL